MAVVSSYHTEPTDVIPSIPHKADANDPVLLPTANTIPVVRSASRKLVRNHFVSARIRQHDDLQSQNFNQKVSMVPRYAGESGGR